MKTHDKSHSSIEAEALYRPARSRRRKRIRTAQKTLFLLLCFLALYSYLTNPFTRFSVIRDPLTFISKGNEFTYNTDGEFYVLDNPFARAVGSYKSLWHILTNRLGGGGATARQTTLDGIIDNIHALRFSRNVPYIISGDHFSVLYPRSLGIFYHTALDPRTARSQEDWLNRQKMYFKTTMYALKVYKDTSRLSTTIVPIGPHSVTIANFFNPPSDTMYSLLYGLETLRSTNELSTIYNFERLDGETYSLETTNGIEENLRQYHDVLSRHFQTYILSVTDPETGLIRKDIGLSSTKDSVVRSSAFYDNVILWKTHQLAQRLGVAPSNPAQLDKLKQMILDTFWLPKEGYFLEELSDLAISEKHYSSDWLIAYTTGFLDPKNPQEKEYFTRGVAYIRRNELDRPFALIYEPPGQKSNLYWILKVFAPSYGTRAIWSYWGMEYASLLSTLYQSTCESSYLTEAAYQVDQYSNNIVKTRGYPELYTLDGKPYVTLLYESVSQTGWVVGFEQTKAMLQYTQEKQSTFCPASTSS